MRSIRFAGTFGLVLGALAGCDSSGDDDGASARGGQAGGGANGGSAASAGTPAGAAGTPASGGSNAGSGPAGGAGNPGAGGGAGGGTAGSAGALGGASNGGTGTGGDTGAVVGSAGAAAGAGGAAGTGSSDPCASALFCDDFESYTVGQAPSGSWTQRTSNGSVAVDETRHASGTKAVKFTTTGTNSSKTAFIRLLDAPVFPAANDTFYGRMLFYLEAAPTASVHWTFIQGGGLVEGQNYHALYRYGGQQPVSGGNQLMANYETPDSYNGTGPSTDCWHHSNGKTVPVGVWACAEWKFDGASDEMRFWLDGVAIEDLTVSGTGQGCVNQGGDYRWTAPAFSTLDLGWESYQTDSDRTLYIDDVVISTTPIGCPE